MKEYQFPTTKISVEDKGQEGRNLNSLQIFLEKKLKKADDEMVQKHASIIAYGIVIAIGEKLI